MSMRWPSRKLLQLEGSNFPLMRCVSARLFPVNELSDACAKWKYRLNTFQAQPTSLMLQLYLD